MGTADQEGKVDTDIQDGIGTITFFHPKSNSLPGTLLKQIAEAIIDLGRKDEVNILVLQSEGEKAFCAGASFDELVAIEDEASARKCPKLILGRVQGKAVGGGVGMAAASDYCLATDKANIKLSELAIGIGPFVVGPAVERKIGRAAFSTMSIDTAWLSAEWAKIKGLYVETYPSIGALDEALHSLSHKLAGFNPEAMKELKTIFWEGTEDWDTLLEKRAELSGKLVLSEHTKKAIERFKAGAR